MPVLSEYGVQLALDRLVATIRSYLGVSSTFLEANVEPYTGDGYYGTGADLTRPPGLLVQAMNEEDAADIEDNAHVVCNIFQVGTDVERLPGAEGPLQTTGTQRFRAGVRIVFLSKSVADYQYNQNSAVAQKYREQVRASAYQAAIEIAVNRYAARAADGGIIDARKVYADTKRTPKGHKAATVHFEITQHVTAETQRFPD